MVRRIGVYNFYLKIITSFARQEKNDQTHIFIVNVYQNNTKNPKVLLRTSCIPTRIRPIVYYTDGRLLLLLLLMIFDENDVILTDDIVGGYADQIRSLKSLKFPDNDLKIAQRVSYAPGFYCVSH